MATAILIGKGVIGREKSLSSSEKVKKYAYGIEWDEADAPLKPKRIGNLELHKTLPIQNALKGCVAQNGNIMYYLDENDWAYKQDGTPSRLDGYDGEVQVEIPKFYLWHEEEGTIKRVYISLYKIVPYATEIPHMLMDAYRATLLNKVPENMGYLSTLPVNSAISVVNTEYYCRGGGDRPQYDVYLETDPERSDLGKSRTSINRGAFRTYARNAHKELMCFTYYWAIFYWLYVIEYANFNSQDTFNNTLTSEGYKQGGLGNGVTTIDTTNWNYYNSLYPLTPCGYCNELGNGTGLKTMTIVTSTTYNFSVPRWRGFDNPFGNIWTNLEGVIIETDPDNNTRRIVYTTTNPELFGDTNDSKSKMSICGYISTNGGYTANISLGNGTEFLSKSIGASKYYDYIWNTNNKGLSSGLVGGGANDGDHAGLTYLSYYYGVDYAYPDLGFRSLKILN